MCVYGARRLDVLYLEVECRGEYFRISLPYLGDAGGEINAAY